jgi:hypothetical protein
MEQLDSHGPILDQVVAAPDRSHAAAAVFGAQHKAAGANIIQARHRRDLAPPKNPKH